MNRRTTDETVDEALRRLRRENNHLKRRLQELQTRMTDSVQRWSSSEEALRNELTEIKASRTWRIAVSWRNFRSAASLRSLQETFRGKPRDDHERMDRRTVQYQAFLRANELTPDERERLRIQARSLSRKPLISIVMPVFNTDSNLLGSAIDSVTRQIYDRWELCIVDDASDRPETLERLRDIASSKVRVTTLNRNLGIAGATNEGIDLAAGEYIVFMDHDDELSSKALLEVVFEINASEADFVYSDEDYIDARGQRTNPHFKPDFSPDLLLSHNYITHLVAVRRDLLSSVGGLREEFDGAQDYDFVLRATEKASKIRHIPKVLYHWRMSETSTSIRAESKPEAAERGRLALNEALKRRNQRGEGFVDDLVPHFYRVRYFIKDAPLVSIIVPFRDQADLLHCAVGDILEKSTYANFEIIGISNNSTETGTFEAMRDLSGIDKRVNFVEYDVPFNYSAVVNYGVGLCSGRHVVLLNNDIRILSGDWLEALLEHSQRDEIGAVGGKLYYPDNRVQHAGIVVGIGGYAGHSHKGFSGDHQGYFNRLRVVQNVSAVTGAFMMVKKAIYNEIGGFDADHFAVACNDVDFCLRLREKGYWNLFTPYAEAHHIESASRGYEDTPEKKRRFARERALFAERHGDILERGDPFYNPNLTDVAEDFSLRTTVEA